MLLRGEDMKSLKEWADVIMKARTSGAREKKATVIKVAETLVQAGKKEAIRPVLERAYSAGSAWYTIGVKTFNDLRVSAADYDDVTVERICEFCDHLYPVKIKIWKIRSCDCAAAPCPKCAAFQVVDLDLVRKDRFGACQ